MVTTLLVLVLAISPFQAVKAADGIGLPHLFWGKVTTNTGTPAAAVQVTVWVNGIMGNTITTDSSGQYGTDPLAGSPYFLTANGQTGDLIVFKVNGVAAQGARLGTLVESPTRHWDWQVQNPPLQLVVFQNGQVNGLDMVYNPAAQDTTPPAAVTNLLITAATSNSITLTWTAVGDDGNTGRAIAYDIRYRMGGAVTNGNWASATHVSGAPVPKTAGGSETLIVTSLNSSTTYYFGIKAADEVPNWSGISNSPSVTTAAVPSGGTGLPHFFWGKVTTATGVPAAAVQVTVWINGVIGNTIITDTSGQYGTDPLVGSPYYLAAIGKSGDTITFKVNGVAAQGTRLGTLVESPTRHWDWQVQNPPLQTVVFKGGQVNGLDLVYQPAGVPDTTAPGAITNLGVSAPSNSTITLTWTAVGDDGGTGTAASYDIRYRTDGFVTEGNWGTAQQVAGEPVPKASGQWESFIVTGLSASTVYYFGIKAADEVPNWSGISNSPVGTTLAPASGGGGGGGGGGGTAGLTSLREYITNEGRFIGDVTAVSGDSKVELFIPKDTIGKNILGSLLTSLWAKEAVYRPVPPTDSKVVSPVYDIYPSGATFYPPVTLTFKYDASELPKGADELNLYIASWDTVDSQWVHLESRVNPGDDIVSTKISHLSLYTVMAGNRSAAFTVSDLTITPTEVNIGKEVAVSVLVSNTGDLVGDYEAILLLDNVPIATKEVTLAGGSSEVVSFFTAADTAGIRSVGIGGLSGTFGVLTSESGSPPPAAPAVFTVSDLTITPAEVNIGEEVVISVLVGNDSIFTDSSEVVLRINNVIASSRVITLAGNSSQRMTFTITKDVAGSYTASVADYSAKFEVRNNPVVLRWYLVLVIVCAVATVGLVLRFLVFRRRKHLRING